MQAFRPFRATVHRQQKYYSQRRPSLQSRGSVFNLPRQILIQKSVIAINPQNIKPSPQSQHKIATDYQTNLKNSVKKNSLQIINKKALQKIAYSFVQMEQSLKSPRQKIPRNNSSQMYPNKNKAFNTLNILYRTIIETKGRKKQKQTFQLSAKRLPILQKGPIQSPTAKKITQVFARNSSFDKYKLNLTTINKESPRTGLEKYNDLDDRMDQGYQVNEKQFEKSHLWTRRRRFERQQFDKNVNQIVPWGMFEPEQEVELYQ